VRKDGKMGGIQPAGKKAGRRKLFLNIIWREKKGSKCHYHENDTFITD